MNALQKKVTYLVIILVFMLVALQIISLKVANLDGARWMFTLLKGGYHTDDQFQRYTTLLLQIITSGISSIFPDQFRIIIIKYLFSFFYMIHPLISIAFCYYYLRKNNRLSEIIFPIINYLALSLPGFSFAASATIESPSYLWPLVFILTNKTNSRSMIIFAMISSLLLIFTYLTSIIFYVLIFIYLLFRRKEFSISSLILTGLSFLVSFSFYLYKWFVLIPQDKKKTLLNDILGYAIDYVFYTHLPFIFLSLAMLLFFFFYKNKKLTAFLILSQFSISLFCFYKIYTNELSFDAYYFRILIIPLSASLLISYFIVKFNDLSVYKWRVLLFFTPTLLLGIYFDLNSSLTYLKVQKIITNELLHIDTCAYIKAPLYHRFRKMGYNTDFIVLHSLIFSEEIIPKKILVAKEIGYWQGEHYPSLNTCLSHVKYQIPIYLNNKFYFHINHGDSSLMDLSSLVKALEDKRKMLVKKEGKHLRDYIMFTQDTLTARLEIKKDLKSAYISSPIVDTTLYNLRLFNDSNEYFFTKEFNRFTIKDIQAGNYTVEVLPINNGDRNYLLSPLIY